jgi:hypothetical protein
MYGLPDAIIGPSNGIIAGVVDSLAESVAGSKKFPEAAYPFQPPGKTDQRGECDSYSAAFASGS